MTKRKPKVHHVTPPILLSVINQSTLVSTDEARAMTLAVAKQVARDFTPFYGAAPAIEFVEPGGTPTAGGCPIYLMDDPDVDGALGYHDEDSSGMAYGKVFARPTLDNGGTTTSGPNAISVTLSHEVLELIGDAPANKWVDGPSGSDFCWELCDAVEGDSYEIDGVSVSNFVLQAFFDPHAQAGSKFDFLGKLRKPFSMTPGGYQITRTEPGKVTQVFAHLDAAHSRDAGGGLHVYFGSEFPDWKRAAKTAKALARRSRKAA